MDFFSTAVKNIVNALAPYAILLAIVGFFLVFIALAIPSQATKDFAKKHWWSIMLGTAGAYGCINIATWFWEKITF